GCEFRTVLTPSRNNAWSSQIMILIFFDIISFALPCRKRQVGLDLRSVVVLAGSPAGLNTNLAPQDFDPLPHSRQTEGIPWNLGVRIETQTVVLYHHDKVGILHAAKGYLDVLRLGMLKHVRQRPLH